MNINDNPNAGSAGEATATTGMDATPPEPSGSEEEEEIYQQGLRILARILVRAYLRKMGALHCSDYPAGDALSGQSGEASPDPPEENHSG